FMGHFVIMSKLKTLGWREWVRIPDLGIRRIKAKVDTGAKSSCIHAFDVEIVNGDQGSLVSFKIAPRQRTDELLVHVEAPLLEYRQIRSSTGHKTNRPVIRTAIRLAGQRFDIDLTLVDRSEMGFRMLLGRDALRGRFVVDPSRSYACRKPKPKGDKPNLFSDREN
ncbi:MAG: RimK/LysX family protein, partial [Planctomycetota bacterium]|nr:RimK/LysX family protein [Planctomycetota bacterium]